MARSVRSATLMCGVVAIPVSLRKAAEANGEVRFEAASQSGNALKQMYVDAVTGEDCTARDGWRKGVFASKPDKDDRASWGDFHEVPVEAIKEIEEATKIEDFEIEGFIDLDEVPFERAVGCYYVAPQRGSGKAAGKSLRLLAKALAETETAGVLKLVVRTRQYPAVIYEKDGALFVNTMVWGEDFANAKEAHEVLATADEPDAKMTAMAVQLVEAMRVDVETLDALRDDVRPLQQELLDAALAGKSVKAPTKKEKAPADGLEAALEASLAQMKPAAKKTAKPASKPKPAAAKA